MSLHRQARAFVALLAAVAGGLALARVRRDLGAPGGMTPAGAAPVAAAQWALWLVGGYVVAVAGIASAFVLCGRPDGARALLRTVPRVGSPAILALLGVTATAGPAAAASPPPVPTVAASVVAGHDRAVVDPFDWTAPADAPDHLATVVARAADPLPSAADLFAPRRAPPGRMVARTVRVVAGDCLWSLAARDLAARHVGSRPVDVDAAWRRWYATNRAVIGPDPRLLRPGEVLRVPAPIPPPNPSNRTTGRHP